MGESLPLALSWISGSSARLLIDFAEVGLFAALLTLFLCQRHLTRKTRQAAEAQAAELREAVRERQELLDARGLARETLERQAMRLSAQAKELNCLYEMARYLEHVEQTEEGVAREALNLLPPAFQYPAITVARIRIGEQVFATPEFRETPWRYSAPIAFRDESIGMIEVCLLEEKSGADNGPFFQEEIDLIQALTKRLGLTIHRLRVERREMDTHTRLLEAQHLGKMGHWEFDPEKVVLLLSEELHRLVGRDPALGAPSPEEIERLFPREEYARLTRAGQRALESGREAELDATAVLPDGRRLRVHTVITPVKGSEGRIIALRGIAQDVTDLVKAEEERRRQQELLTDIIDTIPCGVFWKDRNLEYLGCNAVFAQAAGFASPDEIVGKTDFDMPWTREEAEGYRRIDEEVIESGRSRLNIEETMLDAKGEKVALLTSKVPLKGAGGAIIGVLGVYSSISDLKHAEQDRAMLEKAIEQSAEAIVITDKEGLMQYVNPAFERITGYTREEAIGQNPRMLKSGMHDRAFYESMWQRIRGGEPWSGRLTNRRKDGTLFEEEATISPVRDSSGEIAHFVGVKRDISRESALEAQLRQAQKMEAIGALAGGIAHDFNNILSGILGFTTLALDDAPPESEQRYFLEEVRRATNRAADLVSQILTFSRQREDVSRPLRLQSVLKESLKLLRGTLPSTIEIRPDIAEECEAVLGDATQIHQVIMNLCTNAYHAMREQGGILNVSLRPMKIDRRLARNHPELKPGPCVCLTVSDTGYGMPPEILDRIFEPYFTTKKGGEGTGLGLATVHGIVRRMGGAVAVESQPGKGTTFDIFLPVAESEEDLAVIGEESLAALSGRERVMFVDDEESIVEVGARSLGRMGYNVRPFTDSAEALKAFRAAPDEIDILVTDMTMPHMTGVELARRVLKIRPGFPIILCTGYSETVTEEDAKLIGIREFVLKPVIGRDLARAIRRTLEG